MAHLAPRDFAMSCVHRQNFSLKVVDPLLHGLGFHQATDGIGEPELCLVLEAGGDVGDPELVFRRGGIVRRLNGYRRDPHVALKTCYSRLRRYRQWEAMVHRRQITHLDEEQLTLVTGIAQRGRLVRCLAMVHALVQLDAGRRPGESQ